MKSVWRLDKGLLIVVDDASLSRGVARHFHTRDCANTKDRCAGGETALVEWGARDAWERNVQLEAWSRRRFDDVASLFLIQWILQKQHACQTMLRQWTFQIPIVRSSQPSRLAHA